jgi:molybdate transport system substrate-binding protein
MYLVIGGGLHISAGNIFARHILPLFHLRLKGYSTPISVRLKRRNAMGPRADGVTIFASIALLGLDALLPAFNKASGHAVNVTWLPTVEITHRLDAGEKVDMVFYPKNSVSAQIAKRTLLPEGAADLVQSGVGIGIAKGAKKPDVSSAEALKAALLSARSIAYATGPSGDHVANVLKNLDIEDAVKHKITIVQGFVGKAVASGQVEIGFQQVPEIMLVPEIDLLGPLPEELQLMTVFSAAIHRSCRDMEACQSFIQFFGRPEIASKFSTYGLVTLPTAA